MSEREVTRDRKPPSAALSWELLAKIERDEVHSIRECCYLLCRVIHELCDERDHLEIQLNNALDDLQYGDTSDG